MTNHTNLRQDLPLINNRITSQNLNVKTKQILPLDFQRF